MRLVANRLMRLCLIILIGMAAPLAAAVPGGSLIDAVRQGDAGAVERLLKEGADANSSAPDGATPLQWAAYNDDVAMADALIRAGAKVNARNELRVTPLLLACTNGSAGMVDRLLRAGADPNAGPAETPLMVAARVGNVAVVTRLIERGADVNAREPVRQQTALMWAVSEKHPAVVRALLQAGANVHARTKVPPARKDDGGPTAPERQNLAENGLTPLLFAARVGDVESARMLLDAGANVNDTAADGLSVLTLATVRGYPDVAILALDRGADANADGAGYVALHWAAGSWESELTVNAITTEREGEFYTLAGLKEGRLDLVKALLAHGADVNARLRSTPARAGASKNPRVAELVGATPLILAAMAGEVEVMRALLDDGADSALRTDAHGTVLMAASGLGRVPGEVVVKERKTLDAATLIIERGADVNVVDDVGNTALHYAAFMRRDSIIRLLVQRGAAVNVTNKYGENPLWVSELALQFDAGGAYLLTPSSAADLLRSLGACASDPDYNLVRPASWPGESLDDRFAKAVEDRTARPTTGSGPNTSAARRQRGRPCETVSARSPRAQ